VQVHRTDEERYAAHVHRELGEWEDKATHGVTRPFLPHVKTVVSSRLANYRLGAAFESAAQALSPCFASISRVAHDPGCTWNAAYPPRVWALLDCPDGLTRLLRVVPDAEAEIE
jgi:hypothetical protein